MVRIRLTRRETKEKKRYFEIDPKYADDINWMCTDKNRIQDLKVQISKLLE